MQIHLSFDTLAELHEFVRDYCLRESAQGMRTEVRVGDLVHVTDTRPVTAEGAVIDEAPAQDEQEPANVGTGGAPSTDPAPEAKPKRKRRTKAEIAADEAAAKAAEIAANAADEADKAANPLGERMFRSDALEQAEEIAALEEDGPTNAPAHVPEQSTASPEQLPELVALAGTIDGADKLAHMNEGREFISKHGFPKYNETFALADVPANIAAHTPEQAALHRAAMQWLAAQGGAK